MDPGFYHSILQANSTEAAPPSSIPGSINYSVLSADAFAQPNRQALSGGYAPDTRAPDNFSNQHRDPFAGNNFTFPLANNQNSAYLPQQSGSNENFANLFNVFDGSVNTINADLNHLGVLERQWSDFPPAGNSLSTNHAMLGTSSQTAYYSNAAGHSLPSRQLQAVPSSQAQHTVQPTYTPNQQLPALTQVPTNVQHVQNVVVSQGPQTRQNRQALQFPQSGVSSAPSQQRRHSRTHSLASSGLSTTGHHQTRISTQHARGRARPTHSTNSSAPRQSSSTSLSSQNQRNPAPAAPAAPTTNNQPTARLREHYEITPQQQAHILRNVLLRSMADVPQAALHVYEESLRQGPRYPPESDTYSSSPSPKERQLDNPSEIRPEPKETEELTVNLECKICMSQLVDTVLLPCGHAILCRWCADQHIPSRRGHPKGQATCPMCRAQVKKKHRIYLS